MQLVPGLTHESAGTYAGILSGSIMIGRLLSAWPLGVMCDRYGRKFVLLLSTSTNAILILAFGFSSSFTWAITVRFFTGLFNGTMVAARVSVTELAKGDHDLETRGMGLVMSMVGFAMLAGPAIGGLLSEPITQYPNIDFGAAEGLLTKYPFLLPNVAGAFFNILSTILVALSVEETLPPEKYRSPKYIITDAIQNLMNWYRGNSEYERVTDVTTNNVTTSETDDDSEADSIEEDLKIIGSHFGEAGDCVVMATAESRASFVEALHRPSHLLHQSSKRTLGLGSIEEGQKRRQSSTKTYFSHNIHTLMDDDRIRACLWCYWITTFASTSQGEVFPLFAMARPPGGLGIEESAIGLIGAGSGLLFVFSQYFIFSWSMKHFGLHKTMVSSCLLAVPPVLFIPIALLIKSKTMTMMYLSIINGIMLISFSNWNAALTITQNRAVEPAHRAKLNALAALGASLSRGGGPIFAGFLVTCSYSLVAQFGSLVMYSVVAGIGIVAFVMNARLEDEDM